MKIVRTSVTHYSHYFSFSGSHIPDTPTKDCIRSSTSDCSDTYIYIDRVAVDFVKVSLR